MTERRPFIEPALLLPVCATARTLFVRLSRSAAA